MKHIISYSSYIYESNMTDFKKEIKSFQNLINVEKNISEMIKSIDGVLLDFKSLFPKVKTDSVLKNIHTDKNFVSSLELIELKVGDYYDSDKLETLAKLPMRWRFIFKEGESELEKPVYMIYKYYNNGWSDIKCVLVQDTIDNFIKLLTTIVLELRYTDERRWFYSSNNSGVNWTLLDKIKTEDDKTISSYKETSTFKKNMLYGDISELVKRNDIKVFLY